MTAGKDSKSLDLILIDELTQPLPIQMRRDLFEWMRAGDIAQHLWNAEVVVYEESSGGRFNNPSEFQLSYGSHLAKSSFIRNLMSTCYAIQMVEDYQVEHQSEFFSFNMGSEDWSPRHHIYTAGVKAGGSANHKPTINKNGNYTVRVYYMGAWRRVMVTDAVPVDERRRPLLPLAAPRRSAAPAKGSKAAPPAVELWPVLIAKAILRVAGEKYSYDPDSTHLENLQTDDEFSDLDIVHSLTGWQVYKYDLHTEGMSHYEMWQLISRHVPMFEWPSADNRTATQSTARTAKTRSTKKTKNEKESPNDDTCKVRVLAGLKDTQRVPRYELPGLAPAYSHRILLCQLRDLPEEKPPDEPVIPLWKTYRWYDWARSHGLYDDFICPRAKHVSYKSLLKLSYSPHLHQVMSTESVTNSMPNNATGAKSKADRRLPNQEVTTVKLDWVLFENMAPCFTVFFVCLIPSANYYTAATSIPPPPPPPRATSKEPRICDFYYPCQLKSSRNEALYLHLDTPDETILYVSLETILPQLMRSYDVRSSNSDLDSSINGHENYLKPGMLILAKSQWMDASLNPIPPLVFFETFGYCTGRIILPPGKHFFRIWIRSPIGFHLSASSDVGSLCVGGRAALAMRGAQLGARLEAAISILSESLTSWVRAVLSLHDAARYGRDFYKLCTPDREWNRMDIGYTQKYLPFMFQNALFKVIKERFDTDEKDAFKLVLHKMFLNPDLGLQGQKLNSIYITRESIEDTYKLLDTFICDLNNSDVVPGYEEIYPMHMDKAIIRLLKQIKDGETEIGNEVTEQLSHCEMTVSGLQSFIARCKAATKIQACYKGFQCRRMFRTDPSKSKLFSEIIKMLHEQVFSNHTLVLDVLRELFTLFPAVGAAFSISKELLATFKLQEFSGSVPSTFPPDVWCPLCKITFNCNESEIQVEMDLTCDLENFVLVTFDNDTLKEIPRLSHSTLPHRFKGNRQGYTVLGYGWLSPTAQPGLETHWNLQVRSAPQVFSPVDEVVSTGLVRASFRDIYLPNSENIIIGAVIKVQSLSYLVVRFSTSYSKVEFEVVVKEDGDSGTEVYRWRARGVAVWPVIQLHPFPTTSITNHFDNERYNTGKSRRKEASMKSIKAMSVSRRESFISKKSTASGKGKKHIPVISSSSNEIKSYKLKVYVIRNSWPLTSAQWSRLMKLRCAAPAIDSVLHKKLHTASKSPTKTTIELQPGDPVFHLEIAYDPEEVISVERDTSKEQAFKILQEDWAAGDANRKKQCHLKRRNFRDQFLQFPGICSSDISPTKDKKKRHGDRTRSHIQTEMSGQYTPTENGSRITMRTPSKQQMRELQGNGNQIGDSEDLNIPRFIYCPSTWLDHFIPLDFIDKVTVTGEEKMLLTPDLELSLRERRREALEQYYVEQAEFGCINLELLMHQRNRLKLMSRTFVDKNWNHDVSESLDRRDQVIEEMADKQVKMAAAMKDAKKRKK